MNADTSTRVHVSLAELRVATSRALEGAGAPAGTERDGARSSVWLESRGLRGAAALLRDLRAIAGTEIRPPSFAGHRADLAGCPILVWGSTLVELAMLEAGASTMLQGCRSPRALLPEAAAQAERGWYFLLEAGESRALVAGDEVLLDRSFAELESADVRLIATAGRPVAGLPPAPSRARLTAADLGARHAASLANGLRLAPRDWGEIREAAARILVPASKRSRSRGAGAEVDDNE